MIESISGLPRVEEENLYAEKSTDVTGRDDFLKMFLAQMQHQDPLNPMDSSEFSAQLAQFSSLEQLFNVNENLEDMQSSISQSSLYQALDFIGKEIMAKGDLLSLEQDKTSTGSYILGGAADCTLYIYDTDGNFVREMSLGAQDAGQHTFEWDGRDASGNMMEPGVYGFEITALSGDGESLDVETLINGMVTRVNMEGSSPLLYVGEIPLTISQIMDIKVTEDSSSPDGDGNT